MLLVGPSSREQGVVNTITTAEGRLGFGGGNDMTEDVVIEASGESEGPEVGAWLKETLCGCQPALDLTGQRNPTSLLVAAVAADIVT